MDRNAPLWRFPRRTAASVFIAALAAAAAFGPPDAAEASDWKWAGSRAAVVHRIPLKDETGQPVVPTETNPMPFSSAQSCAPCHDYGIVKSGRHFNAADPGAPAGRPGEPWIWVDERTGTQIPISDRPWKGVFKPSELGLSVWDMTLLFGRHLPGGGQAEPGPEAETPKSRWSVSGRVEINCLGCHNSSPAQNHSEWARQILRENFRWAATAASGLGEVGGMASRLGPTWDIADGPNPDDSEWAVAPFVRYDRALFDSRHQATLNLPYPPGNAGCLPCHSNAPVGAKKFDHETDVHTAAGIACASCHRHDIRHDMIRGYEGEEKDNPALVSADFTCRACHLGGEGKTGYAALPGRMGAPYPHHYGFPEVHFERLACAVCHSGPRPAGEPVRVRTARANRLGIFGAADWSTDLPAVVEPVYLRGKNGLLTPHRMMWPAYWGTAGEETVRPLRPAEIEAAAGDVLYPDRTAARILAALRNAPEFSGTPVLVLAGKIYELNIDGGLNVVPAGGGPVPAGDFFGAVEGDAVRTLVADFDPADAEAAVQPEAALQGILEALAAVEAKPGEPALFFKGVLYRFADGALEKAENKDRAGAGPDWLWITADGALEPMLPAPVKEAVLALTGTDKRLTETQVARVLDLLARGGRPRPVYISGGQLHRLDEKRRLEAVSSPAAEPVAWPMAHEVRPARQALGWNGCTDCHSATSDFFFSRVEGCGPLQTQRVMSRTNASFMGVGNLYHRLFGLSYLGRPYFKVVLGVAAFVIAAVLLAALLGAIGRAAGLFEKRNRLP